MDWRCTLLALIAIVPVVGTHAAERAPFAPHWIWCRNTTGHASLSPPTDSSCRLERVFSASSRMQSAVLRLAADFCGATVELNGRPLLSIEP